MTDHAFTDPYISAADLIEAADAVEEYRDEVVLDGCNADDPDNQATGIHLTALASRLRLRATVGN